MPAAPDRRDPLRDTGEHRNARADVRRHRGPDEDRPERLREPRDVKRRLAGVDLPPEGVPCDMHRDEAEGPHPGIVNPVRRKHHPGTGGEYPALEPPERLIKPVLPDQPGDGGRLPARDRKGVEMREVARVPDRHGGRTRPAREAVAERRYVLANVTLERKNADLNAHGSAAPLLPGACGRRGPSSPRRAPCSPRRWPSGRRSGSPPPRSPGRSSRGLQI